jgi:hypothetical protein
MNTPPRKVPAPPLASKPKFEPPLQSIFFEFWKGATKQAGSIKVSQLSEHDAMIFFHENWNTIGVLAANTPPTNGEVMLKMIG